MALLPQSLAHLARVEFGGGGGFEGFEVEVEPIVGAEGVELAPLFELHHTLLLLYATHKVLLVPASEDNQLAREVVLPCAHNGGVPIPAVLPDGGGVSLHGVFVEVVNYKHIYGIARERALPTHRHQVARVTHYLRKFGGALVGSRAPRSLDGGVGKEGCVGGRVDEPLHSLVELLGERGTIRGYGDVEVGIFAQ